MVLWTSKRYTQVSKNNRSCNATLFRVDDILIGKVALQPQQNTLNLDIRRDKTRLRTIKMHNSLSLLCVSFRA